MLHVSGCHKVYKFRGLHVNIDTKIYNKVNNYGSFQKI